MKKNKLITASIILSMALLFVSKETIAEEQEYFKGDRGPAGGWVFYDKGNSDDGWRYLEAAPNDQSGNIEWYNGEYIELLGTKMDIGSGKKNTQMIIKALGKGKYAAKVCADYRGGGKKDWFLPSAQELEEMYKILYLNYKGDFVSGGCYWSSNDSLTNIPRFFNFAKGRFEDNNYSPNSNIKRVRAVRAFK